MSYLRKKIKYGSSSWLYTKQINEKQFNEVEQST